MALAYLTGSAVQGSADAFVSAEVATALSGITRTAFRIREILSELQNTAFAAADAATVEVSLSRRQKTAMPLVTDRDVIWTRKFRASRTTSGMMLNPIVQRDVYSEDDELLIVEDPLYLILDSNGTSLVNTASLRIGYERVNISDVDRLTLLTQSLD